jgi:hypothetical protein
MARGAASDIKIGMQRRALLKAVLAAVATSASAHQKSATPKPPKNDLPYLLEAQKLIPTQALPATRSSSKDDQTITVSGITSPARTPLPEPIFLFSPGQINANQFELLRFQVVNGRRQWTKGKQANPDDQEPEGILRLTLRPVAEGVIRIEAAEMLNPGEYALIPQGQNTAFCFTVF